jgi:hypothetical protein
MDAKAAAPLRNTPGLISTRIIASQFIGSHCANDQYTEKIETSRDEIVKRFDALVTLASVCSQMATFPQRLTLFVGHQDRPQHDCQPTVPDAGRDIPPGKSDLFQHFSTTYTLSTI